MQNQKYENGKLALAAEMLSLLLNDLPATSNEINCALREQRFLDAHEFVHKLYGATCYCGVPELKQACKNLERELQRGLAMPIVSVIEEFNMEVDKLLALHIGK